MAISNSLKQFMALVRLHSKIEQYWKFEDGSYSLDIERLKKDISTFSDSDQIMAKFFVCVWTRQQIPGLEFDLIDAAQILDEKNMDIIRGWIDGPFWP